MICPRCQSTKYYTLRGRKTVRCARCRCDFSETSGTLWHSSKLSQELRQKIIDLLIDGRSGLSISKDLAVQYKTVWGIAKKLKEDHESRHPDQPVTFLVGDVVSRATPDGDVATAFVVGFCDNPGFVRVKDDNGKHRIWSKKNLSNGDDDVRRYCQASVHSR